MEEMSKPSFRRRFLLKDPRQERDTVSSQSIWPCKICRASLSRYTCPRCNLPYCSLQCYKSASHQQCAEAFYKDCVMQEMKADKPDQSSQQKLLETLRRFREDDSNPAEQETEEDDPSGSDGLASLEERLGGMNLDGKEYEEIWSVLTAEEKGDFEEFLKADRLSELIQLWQPWWAIPLPKITEISATSDAEEIPSSRTDIPSLTSHPDLSSLFQRQAPHDSVLFSMLNTLYAYVLITRLYNGDHHNNAEAVTGNLLEIAIGLSSTTTSQPNSLKEVLTMVMLRCDQSSLKSALDSREGRALAMLDLAMVIQQQVFLQAALSDLQALFSRSLRQAQQNVQERQQYRNVVKKLEYFMAYSEWSRDRIEAQVPALHRIHVDYVKDTTEHKLVHEHLANISHRRGQDQPPG